MDSWWRNKKTMKNILILKFPYSSLYGGGERNTIIIVEELLKKGFNFFLVTSCKVLLREFRKRHWHHQKLWAGIEPVSKGALLIFPFLAPFIFIELFIVLFYYRFWKKTTILYCLSLTEKLLMALPARILGYRVYWSEHVTFERWLSLNPWRFLYRWFSSLVQIIAISRVIRDQLVQMGIKESQIKVIYNGIDLNLFKMKEVYWDHPERFIVGVVARLEKEKGIEFLLKAVKIVQEFIPNVRAIIVGEGPERKKLEWLGNQLGLKEKIQWVGYQENIEKWYHYFDVLVLPSAKRESFGNVLIEAMASGVPVIASKIGGTSEIIDYKINGLLAKPGDTQDLADKIIYLYNNRSENKQMIKKAREKVEKMFSLERMIRDFYLLFRR